MSTTSLPLVYALVLNHNGSRWLPRCLQSLQSTSYPKLRVVLLDNASTDDSLEVARQAAPELEIFALPANLGFSEANNAGIRLGLEGGASYIALINNDTYVEPDWLTRLVEVAEANPRVGILGPAQLVYDGDAFNTWMTTALPAQTLAGLRDGAARPAFLAVEWVEGSALVARRSVFERVGLLDPLLFAYFEECDLCRRARVAGFEVALVPSSRIHHYRGGSWSQPPIARRQRFHLLRNGMIYNSTDPSLSLAANFLHLLRHDAVNLKAALLGKGEMFTWARANLSVGVSLPAMYRKWRADRRRLSAL